MYFIGNKWKSVKPIQYFCGKLDFVNEYNLRRHRFFIGIKAMENNALFECVNNLLTFSQYYVTNSTDRMHNRSSCSNPHSFHKIVLIS